MDAYTLKDEFFAGVERAVELIRTGSDYDLNGNVSTIESLQGIHDYILDRCTYDRTSLNTYLTSSDDSVKKRCASIFTPAGVFVDLVSSGIVCEGYGRAFKILCDCFDIPCVMIAGKASSGASIGHLWNAVCLNDVWYLVDLTWDDKDPNPAIYTYFLCGNAAVPGRISSGLLSGNETIDNSGFVHRKFTFTYPVITDHVHSLSEALPESVTCTGYHTYVCSDDGIGYSCRDESVTAAGHTVNDEWICSVCGMDCSAQNTGTPSQEIDIETETALIEPQPDSETDQDSESDTELQMIEEDIPNESAPVNETKPSTEKVQETAAVPATGNKQTESLPSVKKAEIKYVKASGSKKVKIKWKKVSGADGYEIIWSRKKTMKNATIKVIKDASKKKVTVKVAQKGKRYYFRVRAWRKVNGVRLYGPWSARKSVVVK